MGRAKVPESKSQQRRIDVQVAGLPEFMKRIKGECGLETVADIQPELPVRTMFTSYNRATGIGGHPMRRLVLMHGQNQSGKSALAMGIAESLRRAGQIPVVFDTEFAAEKRWYGELGMPSVIPFHMTSSLDEVVDTVQSLFAKLIQSKAEKKNRLEEAVGFCFVVDTITKLIPDCLLKVILKEGISKQYPIQAQMIGVWLQILIPQLYRTNSTMILVTQERENMNGGAFAEKYKPQGGQAVQFDASMRVHMMSSRKIKEGSKENAVVVGTEHDFRVEKNKSAGISAARGTIFLSNGLGKCPLGFDSAAEMIEEASGRGCVNQRGGGVVLEVGDVKVSAKNKVELDDMIREDEGLRDRIADALDKGEA
jgi:RecA/RadA recombinase